MTRAILPPLAVVALVLVVLSALCGCVPGDGGCVGKACPTVCQ